MTTEYKYWKWTNIKGPGPKKSLRVKNVVKVDGTEKKAPIPFVELDTIHAEPSDKRSVCNERISNRYMVIQTPVNPFLKGSDYIMDLKIQDTLLRPKDSNITKEQ